MSKQEPTPGPNGYPERDGIEDVDEGSQDADEPDSSKSERRRQERGNRGPDEEPGYGQGASSMGRDERAQLVEDIKKSGAKRRDIAERAARDVEFDVAAAWEELEELDESINARIEKSRATE